MTRVKAMWFRFAAPHSILCTFTLGAAFAIRAAGGPAAVPAHPHATVALAAPIVVLALLAVAVTAARMVACRVSGRTDSAHDSVIRTDLPALPLVIGAGTAGAALALLAAGGAWFGFVLGIGALLIEAFFALAAVPAAHATPLELRDLVVDGILAPVIAFAAFAGGWHVPLALVALGAPLGAAFSFAAHLSGEAIPHDRTTALRIIGPLGAAIATNTMITAAIAVVLSGLGGAVRAELALLAVPIAAIVVVFSWLSLADPRTEWRSWRIATLTLSGGIALAAGVTLVLLVA